MKSRPCHSRFNISAALAAVLAALALTLAAPAARAAILFTNWSSPTNTTWTCPAGVTSVTVEVWGGGGGGGGASSSVSTYRYSGGGGGGAYARMNSMTVTPGNNYTIYIPPVAGGGIGTGGSPAANNGTNGANVAFTGDNSVTITANGGTGGAGAYSATPTSAAAGGAAGAGDASWAGGAGGIPSSTTTRGGGGSGASDTANGNAPSNLAGATAPAGSDTLHTGGTGGTFNNTASLATVGSAPGGGGAGVRAGNGSASGTNGGAGQIIISWNVSAGNVVKANDADNLNLGSSWVGGAAPSSAQVAQYDGTITAGITNSLGASTNWSGILVTNVGGPVAVNNDGNTLTLSGSGIDMSGATANLTLNCPLALPGSQTLAVTNGQTLTLGGSVSGGSLIMSGTGALVLATNNSASGGLTVSGSAVLSGINAFSTLTINGGATAQLGLPNSLTNTPSVTQNGTLDLNGNSETIRSLTGSGTVDTVAGGSPTLTLNNAADCQFDGVIQNANGTLSLSKGGAGKLTLTQANGYGGNTLITGGTVVAGNSTALGSGTITLSNALDLTVNGGVTLANPIMIGANTGSTATGVIEAGGSGPATVSGPITITGSPNSGALFGAAAGTSLTVSGAITSSVPVTTRSGTMQFSSTSSSYSALNVGGTFQLGAPNAIPTSVTATIGVLGAGTLDLNGFNQTLSSVAKGAAYAGTVTNSSASPAALTLTGSSTCGCVIGDAGSGLLGLTVNGGTVTLTANNTYSGATTISLGRLEAQVGGACANSAVTVANAAATLGVSVTDNTLQWTCASLTTSGSSSGLAFDFGTTSPSTSLAPLLVASGSVTFNGSAPTVVVTGTTLPLGTYPLLTSPYGLPGSLPNLSLPPGVSGTLSSDGFTLSLNITATVTQPVFWAIGNGTWNTSSTNWVDSTTPTPLAVAYADPYTVVFEDTYSVGAGPIAVTLNSTVSPTAVTDNSAKNWSISGSGSMAGSGTLTMAGSGTFALATTNTYTGGTLISAGLLEADATEALGSGLVTLNGGALSNNVSSQLTNVINLSTATLVGVGGGQTFTLGGVITNSTGALTKVGNGTLVLAANNTYAGGTSISNGTVSLQANAAPGTYNIASGATLSFDTNSGVNASAVTINGTGTLKLASGVSFGNTGNTYVSLGAGGLVLVTSNATVAACVNGHGLWTNNLGSLQVDAGSTINFQNAGNNATGYAQFDALNGGGAVSIGWSGAHTVFVGAANGSGTFSGTLQNDTNGLNRILALQKIGTGTQTLTGTNTYTGTTTISGGTLALSGGGSITNTTTIIVAGGATFDVSGKTSTFALGTRTLTNSSVGAIFNGPNDCSSGTISLLYDATNSCFTITNGGMTLSSATVVTVNNTGPQLGVGSYKIISKATAGNVGLVAGTAPSSVALGGNGRVPNIAAQPLLAISGNELYLNVPPAPPALSNNSPITAGSTLNLYATNASVGTYSWTGPNGFVSSQQNPSIASATPAASGTYSCTVTVNGVTSAAATTAATVNAVVSTPATISSVQLSNGSLIIQGTNGTANGTYSVLTSTNVAAPLSTWPTNTTGSFTGSGGFSNSISVSPTMPQQFFNIKQP